MHNQEVEAVADPVEARQEAEALARRLEEAVRRAEAAERRLKEAIDALPSGFSLYDSNDRLVVHNETTRAMYPHAAEAMRTGAAFEDVLRIAFDRGHYGYDVEDRERWIGERMERHRNPSGAIERLTHSGRWLRIEERRTPQGGTVVIRTDITDLKHRERELAQKNALLEGVLRNMLDGVAVYDANRNLLAANDLVAQVLDAPASLFEPGATFDDLVRFRAERGDYGDVDADEFLRESIARLDAQKPWSVTLRHRQGRVVEMRCRPLPGVGGIYVFRDVTERAESEARLSEKTALLEAALHNMGEGLAAFDADRKLQIANELAIRLMDVPPELARPGVSYDRMVRFLAERGDFGEGDVEASVERRIAAYRANRPFAVGRVMSGGRIFETHANSTPGGGCILIYRDVTESEAYEAKLAEKNALLEATFDNIDEGILVYDRSGRLLAGNALAPQLFAAPRALFEPGALLDDLVRFRAERGDYGADADEGVRAKIAAFHAGAVWSEVRRRPDGCMIEARLNPSPAGGGVFVFRDVTERVNSERRLAQKTALLEETFENMGEGISVYGPDLRLLTSNALAAQMYGVPAALLRPGTPYADIVRFRVARGEDGDVDADAAVCERTAEFRAQRPSSRTSAIPDGRVIETRFRPTPDGGGIFMLGDATARERAQARIREEEAKFRSLVEQDVAGIAIVREDGTIGYCNGCFAGLLGCAPAEIAGRPLIAFVPESERPVVSRSLGAQISESGAPVQIGSTVRSRDGSMVEVLVNVSQSTFEGRPASIAVVVDVTARNRAQRELASAGAKLAERTALLEATLENMGEGIAAYDVNHRLLIGNTDLVAPLLVAPREMIRPGARLEDLVRLRVERGDYGDMDFEAIFDTREEAFRAGRTLTITGRVPDGRVIDTRVNPMPGGGDVLVFRDVTERADSIVKLNEALRKAEAASQAKSDFLAMASHELRTPMNAIIGMSSLLRESDLPPPQRQEAQAIETAGESLLVIIDDLLEFASLEARAPSLDMAPFDPRALVEQAITIAGPRARTADLSMVADVDPALPRTLEADGGRIRRILVNLLDNAVKYTRRGAVTVRALGKPAGPAETAVLRVEVEDTGTGFAAEDAARLFEPFERGAITDRTRPAGLGLGLAICKRFVDLMGGTIGAESAPGIGSRFWFEIPVRVEAPPAASAPASPQPSGGPRRLTILVAEDIEANRDVLRAMLDKLGHEAHFAADGVEAVEAVTSHDYDAVLMDIQMPNMDGLEATRAIRAMGGGLKAIPVIAVSAYSQPADKDAAFAAGMSGFLAKPVRRSVLNDVLTSLTESPGHGRVPVERG